ncbi:MAG: aminoglycoside phosphotransferase family protein [Chloroflexota bacterium]
MLNQAAPLLANYGLSAGLEVTSFQPEMLSQSDWWSRLLQLHWGGLFATRVQLVSNCKIKRVYYKPEKQTYRVYLTATIQAANGQHLGEQDLFAHLLPPQELEAQWRQAQNRSWVQPAFGPAMCLIPEPGMIVWAYPNDPKVPGAALLAESAKVLAQLQAAPTAFGLQPEQQPVGLTAKLAKYVTGQRCGYLYTVQLADGSEHPLYAKAYRQTAGKRANQIWQQVWDSAARKNGRLHLPQPYSYDSEHHILWQETSSGQPLAKILDSVDLPQIAANVGHQLAALHNSNFDLPAGDGIEQEKAELKKCITAVQRSLPQIADRCNKLYARLLDNPEASQPSVQVPIHASFKPSHILVDGDRCTIIDFDGTTWGDGAYDLGRFIAHLRGTEAKGKLDSAIVEASVANLCRAYNESANQPISQARINWFTSSLLLSSHINKLVKRLLKAFNHVGDEQIDRLLTLAEQATTHHPLAKEGTHVV